MKLYFILFVFLTLIPVSHSVAQSYDTLYVSSDSLADGSFLMDMVWRYHPGDDSVWASPEFNDKNWDTMSTSMILSDSFDVDWKGIGWFRKNIVIDSLLMNTPVAFRVDHYGASEIYLNGKLLNTFGKVSSNAEDEKIYQPFADPVSVLFDTNLVNTLAVRYSNHLPLTDYKWFKKWFRRAGFAIRIADLNSSISDSISDGRISYAVNFGLAGLFLSLGVLYFFLFLFYARRKENLFYSLFTIFIAILFIGGLLNRFVHSDLSLIVIFRSTSAVAITFIFTFYLGFLYSIFYENLPKKFWLFLGFSTLIGSMVFVYIPSDIINYSLFGFILISTLEGLRVIIVAFRKGKKHSWIIGAGVITFVLFIIALFIVGFLGQNINSLWGVILFFIGIFSLPISMSVYLAKDIAYTYRDLELQLNTVRDLSEIQLEQERKNSELKLAAELAQAENERKSMELEEARQLQLSMLPSDVPIIPNLDIAVYMHTATEVGGDYYDFFIDKDGTLTVVIGDATGHGMKAGTVVTATKSLFSSYAKNPDIIKTFHEMTRCLKELKLKTLSMCLAMIKIK